MWTVGANYANRHPAELRRFCREEGGVVRIVETSHAKIDVYWLTTDAPSWAAAAVPGGHEEIEAFLHAERSAARREAWKRRVSAA